MKKYKFPLMILAAFLLAAAWVGVGRIVFGVFGWMAFITLFLFAPVISMYGIVLAIIAAVRQQKYRYRKWGPFMTWAVVTFCALFVVGVFMPDGGDSKDSSSSVLSILLMDRTNSELINISGGIAGWAIAAAVVAAVIAFIFAFIERTKKIPNIASAPASLKDTN